MSSDAPGPRPRQVTIGGWVVAVTSAVLVVTVFDTMANLHSVDTRDRLTSVLTTGSAKDLGISVADALTLIRGALFVAGVAAVVTGILGIFVLQRHTTARIVLTVAAVPVVLTAPFAGGFLGALIGGATALLWTRDARDWFAGRAPAPRTVPARQPVVDVRRRDGWPPPTYGVAAPVRPRATPVPSQVRIACLITWLFSALSAGLYLVVIVAVAVDRARVLDLLRDNAAVRDASLSDDQLVGLLVGVSAVVIAWCIVSAVLAALTWRRQRTGWLLLVVSVGVAAVGSVLGLPYSLVNLAACVTTFVLLLRPEVRAWLQQGGPPAPDRMQDWPPPSGPPGKPPVW